MQTDNSSNSSSSSNNNPKNKTKQNKTKQKTNAIYSNRPHKKGGKNHTRCTFASPYRHADRQTPPAPPEEILKRQQIQLLLQLLLLILFLLLPSYPRTQTRRDFGNNYFTVRRFSKICSMRGRSLIWLISPFRMPPRHSREQVNSNQLMESCQLMFPWGIVHGDVLRKLQLKWCWLIIFAFFWNWAGNLTTERWWRCCY